MLEHDKRLTFFKDRIKKQLYSLKECIGETRYKLYIATVEECDDYTELREMAELELQVGAIEYTNSLKEKLADNNMSLDSLKGEDTSLTDYLDKDILNAAQQDSELEAYCNEEDYQEEEVPNMDEYFNNHEYTEEESENNQYDSLDSELESIFDEESYQEENEESQSEDLELESLFDDEEEDETDTDLGDSLEDYLSVDEDESSIFEDELEGYVGDSEDNSGDALEKDIFEDELEGYINDAEDYQSDEDENSIFEDELEGYADGDYEEDNQSDEDSIFDYEGATDEELSSYFNDEDTDELASSDIFDDEALEDYVDDGLDDYVDDDSEDNFDELFDDDEDQEDDDTQNNTMEDYFNIGNPESVNKSSIKSSNTKTVDNVFINGTDKGKKVQKTFSILNKLANKTEKKVEKVAKVAHNSIKDKMSLIGKSDMFNLDSNSNRDNDEYIDF